MTPRLTAALLAICGAAALASTGPTPPEAADLVLRGGLIHTVDPYRPRARAVAILGDRIVYVGSDRGALTFRSPRTRVIDLDGRTVVPGFIDAHAHLANLADLLMTIDLRGTASYGEVVAAVRDRARETPRGQWIVGRGWDQNDWSDTRFPTHEPLSAAVPGHPVYLERVDGHAALVNARALAAAGITRERSDPPGGRIVRDPETGDPTGVLVDQAAERVAELAAPARDRLARGMVRAFHECLRWGVTSVHDTGMGRDTLALILELARERRLPIRVYAMIQPTMLAELTAEGPRIGLHERHVTVRAVKITADGALGSRGAALFEPYDDEPGNLGLVRAGTDSIRKIAVAALESGFQLAVHAIGDRANRVALDAFELALAEVPVADHRFRIEHAQVLHPDDVPRFAELDVIPSMQPSHQISDMPWAGDRIGPDRLGDAYAWRSLLETGVPIAAGTDFPVEAVNPFRTFLAAVARQDERGHPPGGWYPEQRMTRAEALRSMTGWAAYAAFEEETKGSIAPGKLADLVVLSQDIMSVEPDRLLETRVEMTVVAGRIAYEAP